MKITIESSDSETLNEALRQQVRFWVSCRNDDAASLRKWARKEVRAAIRLIRAVKGAKQ